MTRKKEKETSFFGELLSWIIYIAIIIVLTFVIVTYVGQRTKVIGSSMEYTLSDGDQLIVDKISYRFKDPERFDIIVFPHDEDGTFYIKRIIGLPGETVQVVDGAVYIDGELLTTDVYGAEPMEYAWDAEEPITLGEDEYFVLGDNRNHSSDSRDPDVGLVKKDKIMGRAFFRIYPFDRIEVLKHD